MGREQWMAPAALWPDSTHGLNSPGDERFRPWLAMFAGDNFFPDFLDLLAGKINGQRPDSLVEKVPDYPASDGVVKLYQPVLERYYLVTGSLVCRNLGLPDHRVDRQNGEETFFVIRRKKNSAEQGWLPRQGWQTLNNSDPVEEEEKFTLFPAPVRTAITVPTPFADAFGLSKPGYRTLYAGYVPVTNREKYLGAESNPDEGATFILRLIYSRPGCPPVTSLPTIPFRLARAFDPAIPVRKRGKFEGSPPHPPGLASLVGL